MHLLYNCFNMNIGIYANETRDINFAVTDKLLSLLKKHSANCALFENYNHGGVKLFNLVDLVKFSDVIIVLGGDGTILNVIKECAKGNVPVAGINLGHLGFLLDYSSNELDKLIDGLFDKSYKVENRALIEVNFNGNNYLALNDIVIAKGENTKLINVNVDVDNKLLDNYFCDGVIVSTATGSTAYSMSVGGPILAPNVDGIIINPISSHSLHSRPVVVSDKSTISLECSKLTNDCQLVVDGVLMEKIMNNHKLNIYKSKFNASFIRMEDSNFYEILLKKLNKWSVTEREE